MGDFKQFQDFINEQHLKGGRLPDDYIQMYSRTVNDLKQVQDNLDKMIDIIEKSDDPALRDRTGLLYKCKNDVVKAAGELTKVNG